MARLGIVVNVWKLFEWIGFAVNSWELVRNDVHCFEWLGIGKK